MLVTGGDFSYVENFDYPYIGYFTCAAPASVKAYYSPNGTDTWKELALGGGSRQVLHARLWPLL